MCKRERRVPHVYMSMAMAMAMDVDLDMGTRTMCTCACAWYMDTYVELCARPTHTREAQPYLSHAQLLSLRLVPGHRMTCKKSATSTVTSDAQVWSSS